MTKYNELQVASHKDRKRVGRGISAGGGKTAGRGTKGQNSRTGKKLGSMFQGGQNGIKSAIPKFAHGGIVTGPTVGMIGEAGQPEVILPLSKINQFLSGEGQGNGGALTLSVSGDVFTFGLARNARKQSRLY